MGRLWIVKTFVVLAAVALVPGCSSDDGAGNCLCDVTINGENAMLTCGSSACVAGRTQMCGDDATITQGGTCGGSSTFDCNGGSCDTGAEYCLETFTGSVRTTSDCTALPSGCSSCSCAQDDAPAQFPGTNNCASGATISCSASSGEITVTCQR